MKDPLPPLREIVAMYGLSARHRLGQNFLFDFNITHKIARAVPHLTTSTILEIGPGPGGLTRALLAQGARHVVAIEKDQRFQPALNAVCDAFSKRLTIVYEDALTVDETRVLNPITDAVQIAANLPYNVASPLIAKWLGSEPWPSFFGSLTIMVQKEVALRMTAQPKSKAFGRLAALCQWRSHAKILFSVPPQAFVPRPAVTSSVVQITPRTPCVENLTGPQLSKFTALLFGHRRKTINNSLRRHFPHAAEMLKAEGIDVGLRPEALTVREIARLALVFSECAHSSAS